MQENDSSTNEKKTMFAAFLDVMEARDKRAQVRRQLQREKYLRVTQKIHDFHERQRRDVAELRRCLDFVSQHAQVLETVLRSARGGGADAPLSAKLVSQAAALQRCMAQCVADASRIRQLLTATHQPQMDIILARMEAELSTWTAFLEHAGDATYNTEAVIDNLDKMIASQRRCVREVASSSVFTSLPGGAQAEAEAEAEAGAEAAAGSSGGSPLDRRAPSLTCSTPIARD